MAEQYSLTTPSGERITGDWETVTGHIGKDHLGWDMSYTPWMGRTQVIFYKLDGYRVSYWLREEA